MAITYNPYNWEIRKNPNTINKQLEEQLQDKIEVLKFKVSGLAYHHGNIKRIINEDDLFWITQYANGLEDLITDIRLLQFQIKFQN